MLQKISQKRKLSLTLEILLDEDNKSIMEKLQPLLREFSIKMGEPTNQYFAIEDITYVEEDPNKAGA